MTSNEEKQRIDRLELFDEYEPWHQKCSHYLIISATKGDHLTQSMFNLYNKIPQQFQANPAPESSETNSLIQLKLFNVKFGTRFGHSICFAKNKLFLFGGFGEMVTDLSGKHMRHCSFEIFNFEKKTTKCLNQVIDPKNLIGNLFFFQ
jgi:tRNA wybutosine-synthesizing protein 4